MTDANNLRLQKYLSSCGICSRRKAEELILQGRISINGTIARELGKKINPYRDKILLDNKLIKTDKKVLYLFYKPRNILSTLSDPRKRPTIADYLKDLPCRVYPIGRLDFDSSGLILLTNDGDYAQEVLHPKFKVPKIYLAKVTGQIRNDSLKQLCKGVMLDDGLAKAINARTITADNSALNRLFKTKHLNNISTVEITVTEGRKHLVKKMLAKVGHPVIELCRTSFAGFELGNLKEGEIKRVNFN